MVDSLAENLQRARAAIAGIPDPEIPNVSIVDLGIVRSIVEREGAIVVTITPTYSGCPAMYMIERGIESALRSACINSFKIEKVLSPAWTTAWITETGKQRLIEAGIAPPLGTEHDAPVIVEIERPQIPCPQCGSNETELVSQFGSTACKAFYRCTICLSSFEYFKPI